MQVCEYLVFHCDLALDELVDHLGLERAEYDSAQRDEWFIGSFGGFDDVDLFRSHGDAPGESATWICRWEHGAVLPMPQSLLVQLLEALQAVASDFVVMGQQDGVPFEVPIDA